MRKEIFIRLATKLEQRGGINMSRGFASIPDKQGYKIGYKPYDPRGKGYYYYKFTRT